MSQNTVDAQLLRIATTGVSEDIRGLAEAARAEVARASDVAAGTDLLDAATAFVVASKTYLTR